MEQTIYITECDVCGRTEHRAYISLQRDGWTKYKFLKEWKDGAHSGDRETEIIVCPQCDGEKANKHFFYNSIKK